MRFKESIQYMMWKGAKDFVLIATVAVISGAVLALLLRPTGIEAQTYTPDTTDVQTPEVKDTSNSNENKDDLCSGYTNPKAKAQCQADKKVKASTGDATASNTSEKANETTALVSAWDSFLLGTESKDEEQAMSPYWRKIYASIAPGDKYGIAGVSMGVAYTAMLYNPMVPADTTAYYAYNFIPKSIRQEVLGTDSVYAASWTLGNPPDGVNSFKYLNQAIGQIWLAMFKVSTGIFVVVLAAAGIMIILRQKVGQNVVSVYMALKNIVIGYIGAFLSMGFGAFFFTFSKWLMIVFAVLLKSITVNGVQGDAIFLDGMISGSFAYAWYAGKNWFKNMFSMQKSIFFDTMVGTVTGKKGSGIFGFISGYLDFKKQVFEGVIGGFFGLVIIFALAVAILWIFFKLFIKVIKIYISMLIDVVLAPIFFLLGSIPGNEATISDWFKRMFKNSLKVPMIFLVVNIGFLFMSIGDNSLKAISGGALGTGGTGLFTATSLYNVIPLVVIASANGIDKLIDQMFGGPSKTAGTIAAGAQELLKGIPVIGGAAG